MILKPLFLRQVPDILFVPINISYERIMEEKLFSFELLGVPKPKESTTVSVLLKFIPCIKIYQFVVIIMIAGVEKLL